MVAGIETDDVRDISDVEGLEVPVDILGPEGNRALGLTELQARLAVALHTGLNGIQAGRWAGYKGSDSTLSATVSHARTSSKVVAAMEMLSQGEIAEEPIGSNEELMQLLWAEARRGVNAQTRMAARALLVKVEEQQTTAPVTLERLIKMLTSVAEKLSSGAAAAMFFTVALTLVNRSESSLRGTELEGWRMPLNAWQNLKVQYPPLARALMEMSLDTKEPNDRDLAKEHPAQ